MRHPGAGGPDGVRSAGQQWVVGPNGELINVNSSRCLDDTGGSTVNGTRLDQQDCYGSGPEVWAAT
jgi:hypothetical protein